jgi:glycosyltransferase involved in cell wall biosynthesis
MNTDPQAARVLMVVPQYPYPVAGGLERQAHELARALVERGHEVQVVSGRTSLQQPAEGMVEGVVVHRLAWSSSKVLRFLRVPWGILGVLVGRRASFDVVHVHQLSWFSLFAVVVAKALGKPVLAKVPGVGPYGLPGLRASTLGAVKMAIVRRVDAVIAMSAISLDELLAEGFTLARILRTPNGIRIPGEASGRFNDGADRSGCRVVFVGRLSAEKAVDGLLRVWKRIQQRHNNGATLELWGEGPMQASLEVLARDLAISDSVAFCGHVEGVRDRLGGMDVFVLPSRTEGNSNAVLEAMAAGLPVVSTRVGGTPMQVGPAGAALLCEPGDEEGLFNRLEPLVVDAQRRRAIGSEMRLRITESFDIRRIAATYSAAYALLAAGGSVDMSAIANPVVTGSS